MTAASARPTPDCRADAAAGGPRYCRRRPEDTTLYGLMRRHAAAFFARGRLAQQPHRPDRRGDDHPAFRFGGEPEHPYALPRAGPRAGRRLWGRGGRAAAFRGGGGADASTAACAAGGDDRAADAAVRAPRRRDRRTGSRLARGCAGPGGRRGRGADCAIGVADASPGLDDLSHRHRPACRPPHRDDRRRPLRRGSGRGQAALRRDRRLQPACGDPLSGR